MTDNMHPGDEALLRAAQTGEGAIPVTKDLLEQMQAILRERFAEIETLYPALVEACPYEMKLAVTAWVMRHIVDHARDGGTFRDLIYERLGFDLNAYVPLYQAGGMTISNEFLLGEADPVKDGELAESLRRALWPTDGKPVFIGGGKEPWLTVCRVTDRLEVLALLLRGEQDKRRRVEAELQALRDQGVVIPKGDAP